MNFKTFVASKDDNDRRIDKIIRKFIPDISLSAIYKYIRKGLIKVNNKKIKPETHVFENDSILIADFLLDSEHNADSDNSKKLDDAFNELQIVYESKDLLIINKPYDVVVQGDEESLDKIVKQYYKTHFTNNSLSFTPGPLHRLDKKTTGLLCFSLSLNGARWFSKNLQEHKIQKKYYGLVQGKLTEKQYWQDNIQKDTENSNTNIFHTVKIENSINASAQKQQSTSNVKIAQTDVIPIKSGKYKNLDVTLVEYFIHTGRMHQIRSQSAFHNFPLLGDTAYGGTKIQNSKLDFYLQAHTLCFPYPNELELPSQINIKLNKEFSDFLLSCDINIYDL